VSCGEGKAQPRGGGGGGGRGREVRRDVACRQTPVVGGGEEVEESEQAQNGKAY
jgi:hypothetical protein